MNKRSLYNNTKIEEMEKYILRLEYKTKKDRNPKNLK